MIDIKLFDSDKNHLLNHRNINLVKEQAPNRLFIKLADNSTVVAKCTLEELKEKIIQYEVKLLITAKEV